MEVKNYTLHGDKANKDFDLVVYGSTGRPAIAFPEGDSSCLSWENNGMVDAVADLVDAGKVQLFCVDTSDSESWHAHGALREYRLENLEGFFAFVEGELATFIKKVSGPKELPLVLGAGMGALNATIAMLRRPKDYSGLLALSGTYDVHQLIEGDLDEPWRAFSPFDLLADLTSRKAEATLLRERQLAFVCGQHGSETGADTQRQLDAAMAERDVPASTGALTSRMIGTGGTRSSGSFCPASWSKVDSKGAYRMRWSLARRERRAVPRRSRISANRSLPMPRTRSVSRRRPSRRARGVRGTRRRTSGSSGIALPSSPGLRQTPGPSGTASPHS